MTLNRLYLFIVLCVGILFSCEKDDNTPPKANFLVYDSNCIAPCEVQFFDESERAISFAWDFGNGETSSAKDDTIMYQEPGNYLVSLVVTASNGATDNVGKVITILSADTMYLLDLELHQYKTLATSWNAWDVGETLGEDFYINIKENGNLIYTNDTSAFSNKTVADLPLTFITNQTLIDDQGSYEIELYDKDSLSIDDFLGSVSFTPLDYNNATNPNPPTQIILENPADSLIVKLNVAWLN